MYSDQVTVSLLSPSISLKRKFGSKSVSGLKSISSSRVSFVATPSLWPIVCAARDGGKQDVTITFPMTTRYDGERGEERARERKRETERQKQRESEAESLKSSDRHLCLEKRSAAPFCP